MPLPDSYTLKPNSLPGYFEAIQNAEAPQRFSTRFLESLDFKSPNDRLLIRVLKDLGFLDQDGVPQQRYFDFLDRSQGPRILAQAIREAFSDLFAVNREAHKLNTEEVKNKLRTLYGNTKTIPVISRIASTFSALCELADFDAPAATAAAPASRVETNDLSSAKAEFKEGGSHEQAKQEVGRPPGGGPLPIRALQYHINIVLPDTREQAVYDSIFRSLREHLG